MRVVLGDEFLKCMIVFRGGQVTLCFPRHQSRDVEVLFLANLIGKKYHMVSNNNEMKQHLIVGEKYLQVYSAGGDLVGEVVLPNCFPGLLLAFLCAGQRLHVI